MHRSSLKCSNQNYHQQSSQKQQGMSTTPLINLEVGQVVGKKAQLLFPSTKIEQEGFTSGDIEQAIDNFVSKLQSPLSKFDMNSTITKMRSIADEQEKKIQKSINQDNQYSYEDAYGFSSAMKYQFRAQFSSQENETAPQNLINNLGFSNENTKQLPQLLTLQVHSQSSPPIQQGESKPFATPQKDFNLTNQVCNTQSNQINLATNTNKLNGAVGNAQPLTQNSVNQAKQIQQQQQQQQFYNNRIPHPVNNNNQQNPIGYSPQYIPALPLHQPYHHNHPSRTFNQNTFAIPPHALTAQKENSIHHHSQAQLYPQQHGYNQLHFSHIPLHHQQAQQQQHFNAIHGYNENYNPMIFMSAPPAAHPYSSNNSKSLSRVNSKNQHYPINQQAQVLPQQYQNDPEIFKRQPLQQNGYHQNMYPVTINQPQQQQQFGNATHQQAYNFSYPSQITQEQVQQQQDQDNSNDTTSAPSLKRMNSLESVQQQLNFDVAKNEESILKSSINKITEENLDVRQNINNSNNQNSLEDFLRESRISCEEDGILSNNKLNLSPSISSKEDKSEIRGLDRSINQDSYPCQIMNNQRPSSSEQSALNYIKSEGLHLDKGLRYEQLLKNTAYNDFLHYESNSDLNFLMDENHHDHLNHCDFEKYID